MAKNKKRKKAKPVSKLKRKITDKERKNGKVLIFLVFLIILAACFFVLRHSL